MQIKIHQHFIHHSSTSSLKRLESEGKSSSSQPRPSNNTIKSSSFKKIPKSLSSFSSFFKDIKSLSSSYLDRNNIGFNIVKFFNQIYTTASNLLYPDRNNTIISSSTRVFLPLIRKQPQKHGGTFQELSLFLCVKPIRR